MLAADGGCVSEHWKVPEHGKAIPVISFLLSRRRGAGSEVRQGSL